jgi:hypothetical protein
VYYYLALLEENAQGPIDFRQMRVGTAYNDVIKERTFEVACSGGQCVLTKM